MGGHFFYWLAWIGWTLATFFMDKKDPYRQKFAFWLLMAIIASPYTFTIDVWEIQLPGIVLFLFLIHETRKKKLAEFLRLFISSFIVMLAYASFLVFEMLDPVWVILDRNLLLAGCAVYLVILLQKNGYNRAISLVAGTLQGEGLYAGVMAKFGFPYVAASLHYLDFLFISLAALLVWSKLETVVASFSSTVINNAEGKEHNPS